MSSAIDSLNLSNKCSFCFEKFGRNAQRIKIDREIQAKFNELVKRKLLSKKFSPNICNDCYNKFTQDEHSSDFISKLEANQKLLEMTLNIKSEITNQEELDTNVKYIKQEPQETLTSKYLKENPRKKSQKKSQKRKLYQKKFCAYCAKYYAPGAFENHMQKVHTGDFKYFCDHCPRKYKIRKDICSHMETHMNPESRKRFPCSSCDKSYSKKTDLLHHIQLRHSESVETFQCECGASFKTKKTFADHKRRRHGKGTHECPECHEFFNLKLVLKAHISKNHKKKAKCTVCGKEVTEGHLMREHMERHLYEKQKNDAIESSIKEEEKIKKKKKMSKD